MYCDCCEEESKTTRNKIKQQPIYSTSQLVLLDVDIRRITISTKPCRKPDIFCAQSLFDQNFDGKYLYERTAFSPVSPSAELVFCAFSRQSQDISLTRILTANKIFSGPL